MSERTSKVGVAPKYQAEGGFLHFFSSPYHLSISEIKVSIPYLVMRGLFQVDLALEGTWGLGCACYLQTLVGGECWNKVVADVLKDLHSNICSIDRSQQGYGMIVLEGMP